MDLLSYLLYFAALVGLAWLLASGWPGLFCGPSLGTAAD